jgi:hypothetical protein
LVLTQSITTIRLLLSARKPMMVRVVSLLEDQPSAASLEKIPLLVNSITTSSL